MDRFYYCKSGRIGSLARSSAEKHHFTSLVYQSIGVVYGDIGTSPLYVYSSTFTSKPSYEDLLGVLSLIIWTLTLMVSAKYVLIVLSADDRGGGGIFALYSLLCRYVRHYLSSTLHIFYPFPIPDILLFSELMACSQANITDGDRKSARMVSMRCPDTELRPANREFRRVLEDYPFVHVVFKGVAVVGVCLMIAGMP